MTAEKFRPTFTTSAERQEERAEERKEMGNYFGARVRVTEGTPSRPIQGCESANPQPLSLDLAGLATGA